MQEPTLTLILVLMMMTVLVILTPPSSSIVRQRRMPPTPVISSHSSRHCCNTVSIVDVLSKSAKLMDMLSLGCDKVSITMDHNFKTRTECWFTAKTSGYNNSKTNEQKPNQPSLRRDSIIELHVRKGGQEQVLEYMAGSCFFTK